jgi:hypothetical protein
LASPDSLLPAQEELLSLPLTCKVYLSGDATTGKTTAAQLRLTQWLENGVRADQILVLTPQRSGAIPYEESAAQAGFNPAGLTFSGRWFRRLSPSLNPSNSQLS